MIIMLASSDVLGGHEDESRCEDSLGLRRTVIAASLGQRNMAPGLLGVRYSFHLSEITYHGQRNCSARTLTIYPSGSFSIYYPTFLQAVRDPSLSNQLK